MPLLTGGWITGNCDDPSIWRGVVNAECFVTIESADFDTTDGTVTFSSVGGGGSILPQPTPTAADSGPWYIKPGTAGGGTVSVTLSFPRAVPDAETITVRAYPLNPITTRLVGNDATGGGGSPGPVTIFTFVPNAVGVIDILIMKGRTNGPANLLATSTITGMTLLLRKRYAISSGAQSECFEMWWRPKSTANITGTTTILAWTGGTYRIDGIAAPYIGSDVQASPAAHSTGSQIETVSVTATAAGFWLLVTDVPSLAARSLSVAATPAAPAGPASITRSLAADTFMAGFVMPQVIANQVDVTSILPLCPPPSTGWLVKTIGLGSGAHS